MGLSRSAKLVAADTDSHHTCAFNCCVRCLVRNPPRVVVHNIDDRYNYAWLTSRTTTNMTVHTGLRCMRHNAYLTCRLYKKGGDFKYCGRWQEGQGQEASQKMAQLAAEAAASCQPICIEQWLLPCSILQSLTSAEHQLI